MGTLARDRPHVRAPRIPTVRVQEMGRPILHRSSLRPRARSFLGASTCPRPLYRPRLRAQRDRRVAPPVGPPAAPLLRTPLHHHSPLGPEARRRCSAAPPQRVPAFPDDFPPVPPAPEGDAPRSNAAPQRDCPRPPASAPRFRRFSRAPVPHAVRGGAGATRG